MNNNTIAVLKKNLFLMLKLFFFLTEKKLRLRTSAGCLLVYRHHERVRGVSVRRARAILAPRLDELARHTSLSMPHVICPFFDLTEQVLQ